MTWSRRYDGDRAPYPTFTTPPPCTDVDVERFFPPGGGRIDQAVAALCARCPAVDACREYAVTHPGVAGYWGGTSEHERHEIRSRRRAGAVA